MSGLGGETIWKVCPSNKTRILESISSRFRSFNRAVVSDPAALAFIESLTDKNSSLPQSFDSDKLEDVKFSRYNRAMLNVEDSFPERLAVREEVTKARISSLSRKLIHI